MPTPLYTYILNIYELYTHFEDNIFKQARGRFFCSQSNGFKYCYIVSKMVNRSLGWSEGVFFLKRYYIEA